MGCKTERLSLTNSFIIHKKIDETLPLGIGEVPYSGDVLPCSCTDMTDLYRDTGFVPKIDFETGITWVIDKMKEEIGIEK